MGQHVAGGGGQQGGWGVLIDPRCQVGGGAGGLGQGLHNLGLAGLAVGDQLGQTGGGRGYGLAVAGQHLRPSARGQTVQGRHIGPHIAIGRRDQRRGPAHGVIARKQHVTAGKAQVVSHMAGGVQGRDLNIADVQCLAVVQGFIRAKGQINAFTATRKPCSNKALHQGRSPCIGGAKGHYRGLELCRNPGGKGRVVQMGMGDKDRRNPLIRGEGGQNRGHVVGVIGAWVDQGNLALAQQIAVGAAARHGRGVVRPDPPNPGHACPFRFLPAGASLAPMRLHLKSLLPRGLFGRAALILVVPVVTIQLIVSVVFIQRHFEGVTRQMTTSVQIEISHLMQAVTSAPDLATAQNRAAEIGAALQLQVVLPSNSAPETDLREVLDWSGREVILTLRTQIPQVVSADLLTEGREARVWIQTPFGVMRVVVDRRRMSASNPHQLLVLMVFASIVMTGVAFVFLRNQMTPIQRLARAAEAFGKGEVVPFRPRGATEVRAAGQAFLDMRGRIERQIEARTQMLSGVSHDLRTPLTRLKLGLSFLPEDDETEALKRDVSQMERLVEEFLSFARGDAMEAAEDIDPAEFLSAVVADAVRAGQRVEMGVVDWPGGRMRLRPQAVRRALENLLGNAARHGTRARVSLTASERLVRLVVEDDGPGIPISAREAALEPFQRLDAARDPNRGGGVGLGLAIAADVARSHGGALRLGDSEALGGLRAELTLAR